jgi:diguanylate cyclase (GGDEF)-like protein
LSRPVQTDPVLLATGAAVLLTVLVTGGLASPLLPLWGAWLLAAALLRPSSARRGAVASLVVPVVHGLSGASATAADLLRFVLLTALPLAGPVAWAWLLRRGAQPDERVKATRAAPAPKPGADEPILQGALEAIRRAADAHQAALWQTSGDGRWAARLAHATIPGRPEPEPGVALEGHPFVWAVLEQSHVRLERGRRDLPTPWAAEMLLVPVDLPEGVLALAYTGAIPPGSEEVAVAAAAHLREVAGLLRARRGAAGVERRFAALAEVVRLIPRVHEIGAFADGLAGVIREGTGAEGAAIALWDAEHGAGEVIRTVDSRTEGRSAAEGRFRDGESRLALAAKHGVSLAYRDLRGEKEPLPLLIPGERFTAPPRSVLLAALSAEGKTIGAIAAWHSGADLFGESESEFFDLLAAVAPAALHNARRYQALDRRASTDALTGLPNRGAFEVRLASVAHHFSRYARPFGLIVLDVDHFKRFNDSWGHEAGDQVLRLVGETLRGAVREVDLAARLGGEEFVVLLPEAGLRESVEAAERIRHAVESRTLLWNGRPLRVTASLGVAACPDTQGHPAELLASADAALYRAKDAGRNRVSAAAPPSPPRGG